MNHRPRRNSIRSRFPRSSTATWLLAVFLQLSLVACATKGRPQLSDHWPQLTSSLQEPEAGKQDPTKYAPPPPAEGADDWVRLNSGEWLKGEILALRDGTLEFDSAELDDLNLDWDDVAEVRSSKTNTILLENQEAHVGTLLIRDGVVVLGGETERRFERKDLLAVVPGVPSEANYWSGKVSFGLTARSGNTDQSDLTGYVFLRRETAATRWDTTYNGVFSKIGGVETANNHRINSKFHVYLTRRLFLSPAGVILTRDPFQNIAFRAIPGTGLGYSVLDRGSMDWDLTAGVGYQYTEFESVQPNEPEDDGTGAIIFGTNYSWDITKDLEFKLNYSIQLEVPDSENYTSHFEAIASVDLIGSLDLDVSFIWDRVNNPVQGSSGVTPEPNDARLIVGLGWDF